MQVYAMSGADPAISKKHNLVLNKGHLTHAEQKESATAEDKLASKLQTEGLHHAIPVLGVISEIMEYAEELNQKQLNQTPVSDAVANVAGSKLLRPEQTMSIYAAMRAGQVISRVEDKPKKKKPKKTLKI